MLSRAAASSSQGILCNLFTSYNTAVRNGINPSEIRQSLQKELNYRQEIDSDFSQLIDQIISNQNHELLADIFAHKIFITIASRGTPSNEVETVTCKKLLETFLNYNSETLKKNPPLLHAASKFVDMLLDRRALQLNQLSFQKLIEIANGKSDYAFFAEVLYAGKELIARNSSTIFRFIASRITALYSKLRLSNDSLFTISQLVGILDEYSLDLSTVHPGDILSLLDIAIKHKNPLLIESIITKTGCPELPITTLHSARIIYKDALKRLLNSSADVVEFNLPYIKKFLRSRIMSTESLDFIFPTDFHRRKLLVDLPFEYQTEVMQLLGIHRENSINADSILRMCELGDVEGIRETIASGADISECRNATGGVLKAVARYGRDNSEKLLQTKEERNDPDFDALMERKNAILGLLLKNYEFSRGQIQEAYDKIYQDSLRSKSRAEGFEILGDHQMLLRLIEAGANPLRTPKERSISRVIAIATTIKIASEITLSLAAIAADHFSPKGAEMINRFKSYISTTIATTFLQTSRVVVRNYHRNWNPDFAKNSLLSFEDAIFVGISGTSEPEDTSERKSETSSTSAISRLFHRGAAAGEAAHQIPSREFCFGKELETEMSKKAGFIDIEDAIFDENDVKPENSYLHPKIAQTAYNAFSTSTGSGEKYRKFLHHLEAINLKCQYGIPGENNYSFNSAFKTKLHELFSDPTSLKVVASILSNPKNKNFFELLASGVNAGIIKVPLVVRQNINAIKSLAKIEQALPPANEYLFAELIDIYDQHVSGKIPLQFLMQYQLHHFSTFETELRSKHWMQSFNEWLVRGWDNLVGFCANSFGIRKHEAHVIYGEARSYVAAMCYGIFLEKYNQVKDAVNQNFLGALKDMSAIGFCGISSLSYLGIPNPVIMTGVAAIGLASASSLLQIDLFSAINKIGSQLWHQASATRVRSDLVPNEISIKSPDFTRLVEAVRKTDLEVMHMVI